MIWVRFQTTLISFLMVMTTIFLFKFRATSKDAAFAKANDILEKCLNYMTCNKLHINLDETCYMYI